MDAEEGDIDSRTVYCGNLSESVSREILYELFNQAGPVESVRRPSDGNGRPRPFAFIVYKHECSAPYSVELFRGTKLFNQNLRINTRSNLEHFPVLDTHLTEFNESVNLKNNDFQRHQENDRRRYRDRDEGYRSKRQHRNEENNRQPNGHQRYSEKERDPNEPKSWAEFNALRGNSSLLNNQSQRDLQAPSYNKMESLSGPSSSAIPDFNALLQLGQQLMLPGMPGMMPFMSTGPLKSQGGDNIYPSMHGRLSGGELKHLPSDRDRRDHHRERERSHPYNDRGHSDRRQHNKSNDRRYSSHSAHDREKKGRRTH